VEHEYNKLIMALNGYFIATDPIRIARYRVSISQAVQSNDYDTFYSGTYVNSLLCTKFISSLEMIELGWFSWPLFDERMRGAMTMLINYTLLRVIAGLSSENLPYNKAVSLYEDAIINHRKAMVEEANSGAPV